MTFIHYIRIFLFSFIIISFNVVLWKYTSNRYPYDNYFQYYSSDVPIEQYKKQRNSTMTAWDEYKTIFYTSEISTKTLLKKLDYKWWVNSNDYLQNSQQYINTIVSLLERIPLSYPFITKGSISSHFGNRRDPLTHQLAFHTGVDLPMEEGLSVKTTASGHILKISHDIDYGNMLIIEHDYGFTTVYGHLKEINSNIKVGQYLHKGDIVGQVGNTGRSLGPHLHYEIRMNNILLNPEEFFIITL